MKVTVIGTGYVGLVVGACLANTGNIVYCVDIDKEKIEKLKQGIVPIYEPGLDSLIERAVMEEMLYFSTDIESNIAKSEVVFITVGTPPLPDGTPDLSAIEEVSRIIGRSIKGFTVVVIKSTVPVGTNERVTEIISSLTKEDFVVVSNPEFLKEGDAVADFMKPDRIVIGTLDERARKIMRKLYLPFQRTGERIYFMDPRSAEMTKYVANAFLAMRISFINEIANLCERVGADVSKVREAVGADERIGKRYLFPGCGYGGSCFPKDIRALLSIAKEYNYPLKIVQATHEVNEVQKRICYEKLKRHFNNLKDKTITVWGLSFKPNTDDIREAPAIELIKALLEDNCHIHTHDPEAIENTKKIFGDKIEYFNSPYQALRGSDALVLCTEWSIYRSPDFEHIRSLMRTPLIVDGRNLYYEYYNELKSLGFYYYGIGVGDRAL